jgi:hypothetical protein
MSTTPDTASGPEAEPEYPPGVGRARSYLSDECFDLRAEAALRAAEQLAAMSPSMQTAARYAMADMFLIIRSPASFGLLVEWWESHVLARAIVDVRLILDPGGAGTCELTADFGPMAGTWELPDAGAHAVVNILAGAQDGRLTVEQCDRLVTYGPDGRATSAAVTGVADLARGMRAARVLVRAIGQHVQPADADG